jgi:3-oxoadipate enol-lactonase
MLLHHLDLNPRSSSSIVLLHGLGANCTSWRLQFPAFEQAGYRLIVPDLRSFGQSSYPGSTSIAEMAGDLLHLLDHLQIQTAHVVGISLGGTVALQFTLDSPTRIVKLVLVNTFACLRPKNLGIWMYMLWRLLLVHTIGLETQGKVVAQRVFPHSGQQALREELMAQIRQADVHGYRATMRTLGLFNVQSRLREIRCPTLVLTSEKDTTVPAETQRALTRGIAGARQIHFSKGGHALSIDQAEGFNAAVLGFLSEGVIP